MSGMRHAGPPSLTRDDLPGTRRPTPHRMIDMTLRTRRFRAPGQPALAYDTTGDGETVIFLHGIGGNRTNWRRQLPVLARAGFRAIAWDARGYGASQDYDGPLEFSEFSADLARFLDHLHVDRAHFVGLSMGGRILQDFHARHAERILTLTLCATMPGFSRTVSREDREEFVRLRKQPLLEGRSPREMAPDVARTLLGPNAGPEQYAELVASISAVHPESYIKTIEATAAHDQPVALADIACPTLLLFGEADTLARPQFGYRMHAEIPGSEFVLLPDTGHLLNIEQSDAFNRLVVDFLDRHRGRPSVSPAVI